MWRQISVFFFFILFYLTLKYFSFEIYNKTSLCPKDMVAQWMTHLIREWRIPFCKPNFPALSPMNWDTKQCFLIWWKLENSYEENTVDEHEQVKWCSLLFKDRFWFCSLPKTVVLVQQVVFSFFYLFLLNAVFGFLLSLRGQVGEDILPFVFMFFLLSASMYLYHQNAADQIDVYAAYYLFELD